tara:strand:+ start:393 stop:641 length:249 start_codon:yes stop_codon:yes gene_type:complete
MINIIKYIARLSKIKKKNSKIEKNLVKIIYTSKNEVLRIAQEMAERNKYAKRQKDYIFHSNQVRKIISLTLKQLDAHKKLLK